MRVRVWIWCLSWFPFPWFPTSVCVRRHCFSHPCLAPVVHGPVDGRSAGEVEPQAMLDLLMSHPKNGGWGVGPNLTHRLVSLYGGHLLVTADALSNLARDRGNFRVGRGMPGETFVHVSECLRAESG